MTAAGPGLQTLLAVRRREEEAAQKRLAAAIADHAKAVEEQRRLDGLAVAARERWQTERSRTAPPGQVRDALDREAFLGRLRADIESRRAEAERHHDGRLAAAATTAEDARKGHLVARREREALDKHIEKQEAEAQKMADRRAEDAASDLAQGRRPK